MKEAGADVEAKDIWGKTTLDLARGEAHNIWRSQECTAVAAWLETIMEKKGGGEAGGD